MKITTTLTAFLLASISLFSCGCSKSESQLKLERMERFVSKQFAEREKERFTQQEDKKEIKPLTAEQAAELVAKSKGRVRGIATLTSIDKDVAQELAKFKGNYLSLRGLNSIDKDVAKELAKFKGELYLDGLTSIDKDVAKELSASNGGLLLNGLTSIDQDVAKELKILKSGLWLNGLSSMDEDVAEELVEIEGELYVGNLVSNPMNNAALKILRSNPSIVVDLPKFNY